MKKNLGIALTIALATASVFSAVETNNTDKLTREERKARAYEERLRMFGGDIRRRDALDGKVFVFSAQKTISMDVIKEASEHTFKHLKVFHEYKQIDDEVNIGSASGLLTKNRAAVGVFVVDDAAMSMPMLIAPEAKWAIVNVAKMKEGNPKPAFLNARTGKEVVRAILYICGAASSTYEGSLLKPVNKISELDDYPNFNPPMDVMNRIRHYLPGLGITPRPMTSYRDACQEGWAPAPTNEIQKAIWDEVHALPTDPIRIKKQK